MFVFHRGYFGIRIAGEETGPIPYDADIGYLKEILLRLNHISSVRIVMESEGVPRICGESSVLSTTLRLTDRVGPRPPIYVSSSLTAPSKRFGANSAQKLSLYGGAGTAILRMATTYTLTCAVCASCTNYNLVFQFGKNISASVPVISATATTISTAISGISDFATSATNIWTNFDISVAFSTATTTLCDASATSTSAITLYSDYGNIPGLEIIDNTGGLITLTADGEGAGGSGIGECSHNGVCDTETGLCSCIQSKIDNPSGGNANEYYYKASNSDGSGTNTAGTRNDCSYIEVENSMCWEQHSRDSVSNMAYTPSCQGRGYCLNSTGACECYKGFRGINCGVIDCPKVIY